MQFLEPKIDLRIPFEPGGGIGADYNRIMRETAQEWVLLLDHDVLLLHPSWYHVCQRVIREYPDAGIFTCWTNNCANRHQKDLQAPKGQDIHEHRRRAFALWHEYAYRCSVNRKWLIAGYFMLTSKTVWKKAGGFPEDGFFGVDNEYDRRCRRAGYRTYRIDGLYCYHIRERGGADWIKGVATSSTLAKHRSAQEIAHSTDPIQAGA